MGARQSRPAPGAKNELMELSHCGRTAEVQALIQTRADLNLQDRDSNTALMYACLCGHESCAQSLIRARAELNLQDQHKRTALSIAVNARSEKIVNALLDARADTDVSGAHGMTPLMAAVITRELSFTTQLIAARAQLDLKNDDGRTALMLAVEGMDQCTSLMDKSQLVSMMDAMHEAGGASDVESQSAVEQSKHKYQMLQRQRLAEEQARDSGQRGGHVALVGKSFAAGGSTYEFSMNDKEGGRLETVNRFYDEGHGPQARLYVSKVPASDLPMGEGPFDIRMGDGMFLKGHDYGYNVRAISGSIDGGVCSSIHVDGTMYMVK